MSYHKKLIKRNNNQENEKNYPISIDYSKNERKKKQVHILVSILWNLIR
jgi:hypothetical protein